LREEDKGEGRTWGRYLGEGILGFWKVRKFGGRRRRKKGKKKF
jgi:hypothetical protein